MKVLVGTIFAKDDETQRKWLDLQLRFLSATTEDYDHMAVVWGGTTGDYFKNKTTVIEPELHLKDEEARTKAHVKGLQYLLHLFRQREDEFDAFLFLDSDAFPIKIGWEKDLWGKMTIFPVFDANGGFIKEDGRDFDIAIILRAENLEKRLHASVLFAKKIALPHISFEYGNMGRDLCGNIEGDVHLPQYETDLHRLAFPLMRSNQWNVHPLACGVYYDMFYHHCCGSGRNFCVRGCKYWDERDFNIEEHTQMLMDNPSGFVARLAGWAPQRYANI